MATDVLVIQTAFVGDLLLSIPLLKRLRQNHPQAKISLLCKSGLGSLMRSTGLVNEVYEADKSSKQSWQTVTKALRSKRWDLVISPHRSLRTLLLVHSLSAGQKIGYSSLLAHLVFDRKVERPIALPEALRQLALLEDPSLIKIFYNYLREASATPKRIKNGLQAELLIEPLVDVPSAVAMSIDSLLELKSLWKTNRELHKGVSTAVSDWFTNRSPEQKSKPLALLAPGSVWPTKMWTAQGYTEAARALLVEGWGVGVMGAPNERALCEQIAQLVPGVEVLAGKFSLWESCEILALSDLLISNDSGAMHMAALSETSNISVFGPTVLQQGYRPWQNQARIVQSNLSCRPCGKHGAKKCPLGTHACMKNVKASDVVNGVRARVNLSNNP